MVEWIVALLGYGASGAVFTAFWVTQMTSLRCFAIAGNVLFMAYGFVEYLPPVILLHAVLLPINIVRLIQLRNPGLLSYRLAGRLSHEAKHKKSR